MAAALDPLGGLLGTESFSTDPGGYKALLSWLASFGDVTKVGVEGGTGSYGAGLARHLRRVGVEVIEVDRPNRQKRRSSGKSDPLDAVEAARATLGGRATGSPKSRDGAVEAIRVLVVAKRSARQARVKALIEMRHLGYSAPEQLRCRLKGLSVPALVAERAPAPAQPITRPGDRRHQGVAVVVGPSHRCARARTGRTRRADRGAPCRHRARSARSFRVGPDTAAARVMAAGTTTPSGSTQRRWAHLCGVAPVPDGSGKTSGRVKAHDGDRQANDALWRIVMVRIAHDPETRLYFDRRVKEGKTKHEVIRILKRYVTARSIALGLNRSAQVAPLASHTA